VCAVHVGRSTRRTARGVTYTKPPKYAGDGRGMWKEWEWESEWEVGCLRFFLLFVCVSWFPRTGITELNSFFSYTAVIYYVQCTYYIYYIIIYVRTHPAPQMMFYWRFCLKTNSPLVFVLCYPLSPPRQHPPTDSLGLFICIYFFSFCSSRPTGSSSSIILFALVLEKHPPRRHRRHSHPRRPEDADPMGKATLGGPTNRLDSRRLYMRAHAPAAKLPPRVA